MPVLLTEFTIIFLSIGDNVNKSIKSASISCLSIIFIAGFAHANIVEELTSLNNLYKEGLITQEEALGKASNPKAINF